MSNIFLSILHNIGLYIYTVVRRRLFFTSLKQIEQDAETEKTKKGNRERRQERDGDRKRHYGKKYIFSICDNFSVLSLSFIY